LVEICKAPHCGVFLFNDIEQPGLKMQVLFAIWLHYASASARDFFQKMKSFPSNGMIEPGFFSNSLFFNDNFFGISIENK